jgi:hypothetical protein
MLFVETVAVCCEDHTEHKARIERFRMKENVIHIAGKLLYSGWLTTP